MGGRPLTALNLVGWPSGVLDFDILGTGHARRGRKAGREGRLTDDPTGLIRIRWRRAAARRLDLASSQPERS